MFVFLKDSDALERLHCYIFSRVYSVTETSSIRCMDAVNIHSCALNRNTRQPITEDLGGKHRHDLSISREGDAADLEHLGRVNTPTTRPQTDSSPCNPAGSGAARVGRLHSSSPVEDEGVSARDHSRGRPGKRRNEDAMDHSGLGNR